MDNEKKFTLINSLPVSLDNQKWLYINGSEIFNAFLINCPICGKKGFVKGMFEYELSLDFECKECNYYINLNNEDVNLKLNADIYISENILSKFNIDI